MTDKWTSKTKTIKANDPRMKQLAEDMRILCHPLIREQFHKRCKAMEEAQTRVIG